MRITVFAVKAIIDCLIVVIVKDADILFALDPVEYPFSVTQAAIVRYQYRSKVFTQWYAG
jgi:hypothetical protein